MGNAKGEIHRILTPVSVEKLSQAFGAGTTFYVPNTTANAEHIAELIGLSQTSDLVSNFGGDTVYLPGIPKRPTGKFGEDLPPSLEDVERLSKDHSAKAIARLFGCSKRTVHNKRARLRERSKAYGYGEKQVSG